MNELKKVGKILIKDSEINILNKCNIDVAKCANIDEVLYLIDMYLDNYPDLLDEEYDEIEYVAQSLMERKYYMESHK